MDVYLPPSLPEGFRFQNLDAPSLAQGFEPKQTGSASGIDCKGQVIRSRTFAAGIDSGFSGRRIRNGYLRGASSGDVAGRNRSCHRRAVHKGSSAP